MIPHATNRFSRGLVGPDGRSLSSGRLWRPSGCVCDPEFRTRGPLRRGTVRDLSGNGNEGQLYGGPALSFDGASDEARADSAPLAFVMSGWALSLLVKKPTGASTSRILSGGWLPAVQILSTGAARVLARNSANDATLSATLGSVTLDEWHHLAVVMAPSDGVTLENGVTVRTWLDGVRQADQSLASYGDYDTQNVEHWNYYGPRDVEGAAYMGPGGVWDRELTDAEVAALYADPYDAGVIADAVEYYKLTDGSGDPSGVNGTTLNLTGASWDDGDNFGPNATGKGYEFDGDTDVAVFDSSPSIHLADSATGWTWFGRVNPSGTGILMKKGGILVESSAGDIFVVVSHATTNAQVATTPALPTGSRSSVAVVYDASSNRLTIYVDGADVTASRTDGVGAMTDDETDDLYVAAEDASGTNAIEATYSEAPLFDRPLTATEIARLHYAGRF